MSSRSFLMSLLFPYFVQILSSTKLSQFETASRIIHQFYVSSLYNYSNSGSNVNGLYNRVSYHRNHTQHGLQLRYKHETRGNWFIISAGGKYSARSQHLQVWSIIVKGTNGSVTADAGLYDSLYLINGNGIIITALADNEDHQTDLMLAHTMHLQRQKQSELKILQISIDALKLALWTANKTRAHLISTHNLALKAQRIRYGNLNAKIMRCMMSAIVLVIILCQVLIICYCQRRNDRMNQLQQLNQLIERNSMLKQRVSAVLEQQNSQRCENDLDAGDMITITDPSSCNDFREAVINASVANEARMNGVVNEMITVELHEAVRKYT
eukprot:471435_1